MRVFLTGFMGSGKSRVAVHLASQAGLERVDLDREIEREAGTTIRQIFDRLGETGFRSLERAALERVARRDGVVVATGGGTMCDPVNRETIARSGVSVWLRPPLDLLLARLARSEPGERPLFEDAEQATRLYTERLPAYESADHEVAVEPGEKPDEVAARIWQLVGEGE